jgi:hypothetical protein
MNDQDDITDLTRGVYRRQYAGFVGGKRINALSLEAEAWFWRVHAAADDFGNFAAEPSLLYAATCGRRAGVVTINQVTNWFDEMVRAGLVERYEAAGECYGHVVGFVTLQPSARNGRRVRRVPSSPWDGATVTRSHGADEAGTGSSTPTLKPAPAGNRPKPLRPPQDGGLRGVRGNPGESGRSDSDSHSDTHSSSSARPPAAGEEVVLLFPCTDKPSGWPLTTTHLSRLTERFPGLDIAAEARAALAHLEANPSKQRTAEATDAFVTSWLNRSNTTPAMRAKGGRPTRIGGGTIGGRMTQIEQELSK